MVLLEARDRQDDRDGQGGRDNGQAVADDVGNGRIPYVVQLLDIHVFAAHQF
ncbi:hypothetical protein ACFY05_36970 [Microtetraspora fusca]|uniref:Uncharacterized protein n=1 Tax=Microtetraspora fusca TaxID=1997 RepID=A0ABW6VHM4_MICFU